MEVLNKTTNKFDSKTKYIFGHAGDGFEVTGSGDDLKKFSDYLDAVLKFAESEMKAGKTKEEFIKNTVIPGAGEWKGRFFLYQISGTRYQ